MSKQTKTFYLFSRPSFIEGVGRILDFGNFLNVYNTAETAEKADCIAIRHDWRMVGEDIFKAYESIKSSK